jgi:phosphopantothenoylcysteine decarboxylase/phosphopantothenate--cysteine ligase
MAAAVGETVRDAHVHDTAAAGADSRPRDEEGGKIERGERESLTLELVRTVDVLASTARPGLYRVGFAAEAGPRLDRARAKKAAKGVDLLVFNDILAEGVGIGSDENEITILTPNGEVHVPRTTKTACARAIADQIESGLAR